MSSEAAFDPFAGPAIASTCPTTEAQREIWTGSRLGDDASLAFNEGITVFLNGDLELAALNAALGDLVARHDALRSTVSGDGLSLLIGAANVEPLKPIDLAGLADAERDARWWKLCTDEVLKPFDLATGPLFRVHLGRFSPFEHRLCFTAHHIVCDGFSTGVLVREWAQLYSARLEGKSAELPPADSFAAYSRRMQSIDTELAEHEKFWVEKFKGEIPVLQLPTDRPRPPAKTYAALRHDTVLKADLITALKAAGAKQRASLFNTLLGGFVALIGRLSNQDDVVVGIPSAGQSAAGLSTLVGHCVNTLPVRARFDAKAPFAALLDTVRKGMLDALEHQEYTFGQLLKVLPIQRDPSRLPLVSVCFNLDKGLGPDAMPFKGLEAKLFTNPRRYETFDLFVNAVELNGQVELEVQYNTDLFDTRTVKRWIAGYEQLLRAAAANISTELARLPIVTEPERAELLAFTRSDQPAPKECVHELFEAQAAKQGDKVAVELGGDRLTYAQLEAKANRIARRLRAAGASKGALVGLAIERSPDMVAGLLGILKSGAGYVPLDPGYPSERLAFMATDAQMPVLLTQRKLKDELKLPVSQVICVDDPELASESDARLPKDDKSATSDSVCYVIYTSGSTGKPKGVLLPHRAVANLLKSVEREPGMNERDTVMAVTTLSFDIAVSEIILPIVVGAKISLASRDVASDGGQLLELLQSSKATFVDATPATWRLLLGAGWNGGEGLTAICTGEALPKDLALQLIPKVKALWNGYGPTETCVWSTFWPVRSPLDRVLIGRPVANTACYVLDPAGQLAPLGVPGELFIGGRGVALGYHGRPDLTAERFVDDPFAGGGAKMYRTGDLCRWLPDGNLECLGRNDSQVKLRGFRIELGEIENALGQHPACRQVAVIVREDRPGDKRLVGYLAFHEGKEATDKELRAHLKLSLPDYMVPQAFVRLPKMPLTPSGKIDRRALPKPDAEAQRNDADFVAPRNDAEKLLEGLWKQALGLPRVSVTDDFFALGGHSLLASQVLARLKRDHGVNLSFRKLFEAPTIEKLAPLVKEASGGTAPAGITKRTGTGPAPASFLQQRLWLLEEMEPSTRVAHHLPAAWRLNGPMDSKALDGAMQELVRRHETLRTTLAFENGQLVQKVHPEGRTRLELVDLTSVPEQDREAKLDAMMLEATAEPFDLKQLPLLRGVLYKVKPDEHVFFTVRHNVIWDGWSFDVFLKEMRELYPALVQGKTATLAPLPVSYGDYAAWHQQWLKSADMERQIAYWRTQYEALPDGLEVPGDRRRPDEPQHVGGNTGIVLPKAQHDALNELARETGTTLFMVLYGAFDVLLYRWTQSRDLLVGTPVRNRMMPELEELIGPFINAIAIRSKLEPSLPLKDFFLRVRDGVLDAFNNQEMPFESLGTRPPVVRAFFSLQDARKRPPGLGDLQVKQVHVLPLAATNDLMLWCMETRDGLLMMLNYSTEIFDEESAKAMLQSYRTVLESALADVKRPVSELAVLPKEQAAALAAFSGTSGPDALVHHAVPAEGEAFQTNDGATGWADVSKRAALLQGHLSQQGIGRGAVAGVGCEGVDRLIATLAALRAGAAVLPVDPKWSPEFLAAHLAAGNAAALIAPADLGAELPGVRLIAPDASGPAVAVELTADDAALAWLTYDASGKAALSTVSHRALAASVTALGKQLGLKAGASVLWSSTLGSEGEALELLLPLLTGAKAVLADEGCFRDGELLAAELARLKPSVAIATGAAWAAAQGAGFKPGATRAVCIGAAPAGLEVTRLSAWLSRGLICVADAKAGESIFGRPLPGAVVEVRDESSTSVPQLAPINMPGALWAGAKSSALRPAAERARWRRDGTLERWGQSNRAERWGMRFPLDLPARVLARQEALRDAAVVMVPGPEERLAAFVVVKPGESFTDTELRRHVRQSLPQAMVPQEFHELDAIPHDAAGAVDYAQLLKRLEPKEEHVPPKTPTEQLLAELWRSALNLPVVSARDNFFNLGGHSLLCFRVLADVEKKTGKRVNPRLMLLSTLEQVAANIDR